MWKMFKTILSSENYWRSVLRLAFLFAIVFAVVVYVGEAKFDWEYFSAKYINEGRWFTFFRSRVLGGLVYGLFVSYFFQRRKILEDRVK